MAKKRKGTASVGDSHRSPPRGDSVQNFDAFKLSLLLEGAQVLENFLLSREGKYKEKEEKASNHQGRRGNYFPDVTHFSFCSQHGRQRMEEPWRRLKVAVARELFADIIDSEKLEQRKDYIAKLRQKHQLENDLNAGWNKTPSGVSQSESKNLIQNLIIIEMFISEGAGHPHDHPILSLCADSLNYLHPCLVRPSEGAQINLRESSKDVEDVGRLYRAVRHIAEAFSVLAEVVKEEHRFESVGTLPTFAELDADIDALENKKRGSKTREAAATKARVAFGAGALEAVAAVIPDGSANGGVTPRAPRVLANSAGTIPTVNGDSSPARSPRELTVPDGGGGRARSPSPRRSPRSTEERRAALAAAGGERRSPRGEDGSALTKAGMLRRVGCPDGRTGSLNVR